MWLCVLLNIIQISYNCSYGLTVLGKVKINLSLALKIFLEKHYRTLGLPVGASKERIKAYRE